MWLEGKVALVAGAPAVRDVALRSRWGRRVPWPVFGKMTRGDLSAIYAYLSAIPSCDVKPLAP
jgi:hypothetical protein